MTRPDTALLWLGEGSPLAGWPGRVACCDEPTPARVADLLDSLVARHDAVLTWDAGLGAPPAETVLRLLDGRGDVWHAGLRLGTAGRPELLRFVAPGWMLAADPDPDGEATSWRLGLRCCLVRSAVVRRLGGPDPRFRSLAGAGLELGHRWIERGATVRHVPALLPAAAAPGAPARLPVADELRFLLLRRGRRWARWAMLRALLTGAVPARRLRSAWRQARNGRPSAPAEPYRPQPRNESAPATVSVLIPTLDRYPWLRRLLEQLGAQTIAPLEVLVVDQTPRQRRETLPTRLASGAPVRQLTLDRPGQSTARNHGLATARGEAVLFLDDDDEIGPELIERHLDHLARTGADASCGVAEEVGAGPLPEAFTIARVSDVFPANNSLLRRTALRASGLFDEAFDHGPRADADLGLRLTRTGALLRLDPEIRALHHRAPRGGLRTIGARRVTYAASRRRLLSRRLPEATELYLVLRHFGSAALRETLWLAALGTFSAHRRWPLRLLKAVAATLLLPHTLWSLRRRAAAARRLFDGYPAIPPLPASPRTPESPGCAV